jgi:hypothetical protein
MLIIEDGSIVENANSYVTEAELILYASARDITVDPADAEVLIVKAMDYIESLDFVGVKSTRDQGLQWPRFNVVIDDYLVSTDEIPQELKTSVFEVALSILNNEDPLANVERTKTEVKVGSLQVKYADGSTRTIVKRISSALRKLLRSGSGSSFEVKR